MTTLTVTSKGQVTFKRELLKHLEAAPGDRLDVNLLPGGRLEVKVAPSGGVDGFIGLLANKTRKVASIEDIGAAAADGWADVHR